MLQRESFGRALLHLPGDYARGMRDIVNNDPWILGTFASAGFSFVAGGMLGLIGSLGAVSLSVAPNTPNTLGVGWWIGAGVMETAITIGATAFGRSLRRTPR